MKKVYVFFTYIFSLYVLILYCIIVFWYRKTRFLLFLRREGPTTCYKSTVSLFTQSFLLPCLPLFINELREYVFVCEFCCFPLIVKLLIFLYKIYLFKKCDWICEIIYGYKKFVDFDVGNLEKNCIIFYFRVTINC